MIASAMGGALARRFERAERVGEAVNSSFWAANRAEKKIERAMGPRISMAPAGWEERHQVFLAITGEAVFYRSGGRGGILSFFTGAMLWRFKEILEILRGGLRPSTSNN